MVEFEYICYAVAVDNHIPRCLYDFGDYQQIFTKFWKSISPRSSIHFLHMMGGYIFTKFWFHWLMNMFLPHQHSLENILN